MPEEPSSLHRSPLHEANVALGGKMVPFAGWEMPVQFSALVAEHEAVRTAVGLFDISHMGQILVEGSEASTFLNRVLTNDVATLEPGSGHYTLMLNEEAGVIDDLILYQTSPKEFLLVVNAARLAEDWVHLNEMAERLYPGDEDRPSLANPSSQCAGLAIQGPRSREVFRSVFGPDAPFPERNTVHMAADPAGFLWLCGTGYTGEEGFEFFCPATTAGEWYERLLAAVTQAEGLPCGLGARDTLRLEMGYPLNGSDLTRERSPLQAGLGFAVKLESAPFPGSGPLSEEKANGTASRLAGLRMTGPSPPPRPHYPVHHEDQVVAELTSGTRSPTLKAGIGMAYLPTALSKIGTKLAIEIRGRSYPAEVVRKPFHRPDKA